MTSNKATLRRCVDAINSGNSELMAKTIDEVFDPGVLAPVPSPGQAAGRGIKEIFVMLRRAYPDLHIAIDDLIEEGDKLVARQTVTGTHLGEYLGLAPTGRSVTYDEIFVFRFVDGRITQTWGVVDVLAQMKQLGLISA
jgi:hypothetical protein